MYLIYILYNKYITLNKCNRVKLIIKYEKLLQRRIDRLSPGETWREYGQSKFNAWAKASRNLLLITLHE